MFGLKFIDDYYGLNGDNIVPILTKHGIPIVAQFLYGRANAWPLATRDLEHNMLTDSLVILQIFMCYNIDSTSH